MTCIHRPHISNHNLEQTRRHRNKGSCAVRAGIKNSQKKTCYNENNTDPHESGGLSANSSLRPKLWY